MGSRSTEYDAIHARLRRVRRMGPRCVASGCLREPTVWAWQRTGPSRSGERGGKMVTWGVDLDDYSPMCRNHAGMLDRGGSLSHCPHGHERAVHGMAANRTCAECNRLTIRRASRAARARKRTLAIEPIVVGER